jgi:sulfoxide reductase catalytic subunit YedY
MLIKRQKGWELPEAAASDERHFLDRRRLMQGLAAGSILAAASPLVSAARAAGDPSGQLYPAAGSSIYPAGREVTAEKFAATYNNFYEFGSHKEIARAAQNLKIRPWQIRIDGLVEKPFSIAIDELLARVALEERVYRQRCVEAWSMVVPWTGFPLRALLDLARPLGSAKYLVMQTFKDAGQAPGQKQFWYPWPYTECLTMAEAAHDLAFLVSGAYGKPAAKQFGAPLRLAVPWKYGFKSVKSINRFSFVERRPKTFWEEIQPREYGFWANVNPQVDHPRWSQASERVLGGSHRIPTVIYNGYGEWVAELYAGQKGKKLFM